MVMSHHIAWELAKERQRDLSLAGKSGRTDESGVASSGVASSGALAMPSVLSRLWRREAGGPATAYNRSHSEPASEVQGKPGFSGCS
jgi:hypothetical protein